MNELQIFSNPAFGEIRTLEEHGKPLFCGSDVAKHLVIQTQIRRLTTIVGL